MNSLKKLIKFLKSFFVPEISKRKMYNLRRRRESVAMVCRKTTKFLTTNTSNLLKRSPNTKKYHLLAKIVEEFQTQNDEKPTNDDKDEESEHDMGERDLDYYLGVRKKETYWRDPSGTEQIIKDYLIYHCGVTEEDYNKFFRKSSPKPSYVIQPKLKQVPFKIHKKKEKKHISFKEGVAESWAEKKGIFKLFGGRRDSDTSESYSECSNDNKDYDCADVRDIDDIVENVDESGVRIKEVSEGRPCDNCPELCPGFVPHPWRKTCKCCGCDRLSHAVYHEELASVRARLGLRDTRDTRDPRDTRDRAEHPPTLTPAQSELYWSSLSERLPAGAGAAGGAAGWRSWRSRALAAQLPKQDLALAHCSHVDDAHKKQFEDFVAARNEIALDIGVASQHHGPSVECMSCTKPIRNGSIMVQAPRIGDEACFHPACFTCSECDELLVELAYCALDGRLYCVRHYGERLKPRCHACDELFISRPGVTPLPSPSTPCRRMGILLSVFVSYVGLKEAAECMRHILSGVVPASDANFDELVEYYTRLQRQTANPPALPDWTADSGQGYVAWTEDADGRLRAGAIKFHGTPSNSTALLFSTKISSFGQYSVDDAPQENGDYGSNRYPLNRTKTIISDTAESFSVGSKNKSRSATPTRSVEREHGESPARMTWQYTPKNATPASSVERDYESPVGTTYRYTPESPTMTLPEIQFQSYDEDKRENVTYSEEYLRSLDGIKFRPLQRSDPSGRRRSFRKRRSSSTSSRESREEELKMFTSLEEAELGPRPASGSTPDLSRRSYSRSRSREKSKDRVDARDDDVRVGDREPSKLPSFEESVENNEQSEVNEDEDDVDFWANIGD